MFNKINKNNNYTIIAILSISIVIHFIALFLNAGFYSDINTFKIWANLLYSNGFYNFYSSDVFTDYPAGYMYILYLCGIIKNLFNLDFNSFAFTFIIKLPAIIFDILSSIFIYKISLKFTDNYKSFLIAILYTLNPAIILISSVWGQVDSIYTFFIIYSIYLLENNKNLLSFIIFSISTVIKPQSLIFTPIYLFKIYQILKINNFSLDSFKIIIKYFICSIISIFVVLLPFAKIPNSFTLDFSYIINQYISTIKSYPYVTINAYNIYSIITNLSNGWINIKDTMFLISYNSFGLICIILITLLSFYFLNKNKKKYTYFLVAAFLNFAIFMFSIKMHERYYFTSLILILICYIYSNNKNFLNLYLCLSATFLINSLTVMLLYMGIHINIAFISTFIGFINLILFVYLFLLILKNQYTFLTIKFSLFKSKYSFIIFLTLIYSILSFVNLGNTTSVQTYWHPKKNEVATVNFSEPNIVKKIQYFTGASHDQDFEIYYSVDNVRWKLLSNEKIKHENVFKWQEINVNCNAKYFKIISKSNNLMLFEIAFKDINDNLIKIYNTNTTVLFDEQNLVPKKQSYKNSTYFDEIYHARSAFEILNNLPIYEITHPPLGKDIMSLGIYIFGMTPFGYRVMGNLIGIFMIPLMYIFSKKIFKSNFWGNFSALLISLDFMHFTQTRIATIDSYTTFFIICMYYFMYQFYNLNFKNLTSKNLFLTLGLSGIFMGFGIACKWQGIYAGFGLAIIFFYKIILEYFNYKKENKNIFYKDIYKILLCCLIFFIVIPVIIYFTSYIPYMNNSNFISFKDFINNQKYMFNYHSNLKSIHPYSSRWWQWPLIIRPIFYYSESISNNVKIGISSFGNPAIWWFGIFAFIYTVYISIIKKSKLAIFLIISYLSQFLPWALVNRTTYIYHYFPSVPFIILMITLFFKNIDNRFFKLKYIYLFIVLILFIMFYPVIAGTSVNETYVNLFLRWLNSWVLIL